MPGSEYYDHEDTPYEKTQKAKERRKKLEEWIATLNALRAIKFNGNRKFEQKLEELKDFCQARMWEYNG